MKNLDFLDLWSLLVAENACLEAQQWLSRHHYDLHDAIENCPHVDWLAWATVTLHHPNKLSIDGHAYYEIGRLFDLFALEHKALAVQDMSAAEWRRSMDTLRDEYLTKMRAVLLPTIKEDV